MSWRVTAPPVKASMAAMCSMGMDFSPLPIFVTNDGGTRRTAAKAAPRPRSADNHDLSLTMNQIVFPSGEWLSTPHGEFTRNICSTQISWVKTVEETRRERLQLLIRQHGSITALVEQIAMPEINNSKVSRIANANVRHDRGGAVYVMGSEVARAIETSLGLETGWMDTPLTWAEALGQEDPRAKVMQLMEAMPPDQWSTAVRLLDALAQPAARNGTTGNTSH